jgi:hypothetical protein
MKNLLYILLVSVSLASNAQLYIGSNSSLYNKGKLMYVKGKIELNGSSALYLRSGGQLLQGTTGMSTNKGAGKLSVFQEGTVNNYFYNYWCSPVGNASTSSGNEDFGITMLNVPVTKTVSNPATMNGSLNGNCGTGTLSIASYWIWKFLSSSSYSQWFHAAANSNISAGQGFTMKGTSGYDLTDVGEAAVNNFGNAQRYDFRGKPNDGNITVNVDANAFTLTGNPYPSALHVNAFLLDASNSACDGVAYYWEQDKSVDSHVLAEYQGGYGTYSPISLGSNGVYVPATYNTYNVDGTLNVSGASSGLTIERKYAPIGQGFMVKGVSAGNLTLKNVHRIFKKEGDYSQFHRQSNNNATTDIDDVVDISQIRLNTVMNNLHTAQIALAFVPTATDEIDAGIDAKSPVDPNVSNDVYFFLNNDRLVIQGVAFDVDKRIALGIKSTNNATFKFDASQTINFDETQPVYLYDALDDSYHDIRNNTYEVVLPTGTYNDRFEITFKDNSLNNSINIKSEIVILQNNTSQLLTVSNPNRINLTSVALYDLTGKQIFAQKNLGTEGSFQFSTNGLSNSVYLVEITTADKRRLVQKILISSL